MSSGFRRVLLRHVLPCIGLLLALAALETWTEIDMIVQRYFYDPAQGWWITSQMHRVLTVWFYRGPKIVLGCVGVLSLVLFALSFVRPSWSRLRIPCLFFALSLVLVPVIVASGKQITNIYCPNELVAFGGKRVYQRLLEPARLENAAAPRGKGFPAGHSTGGFALMSLYFLGKTVTTRRLGLAVGLLAGWTMGGYQMLRGEHFLSHTLTSMVAAWLILVLLDSCFWYFCHRRQGAIARTE